MPQLFLSVLLALALACLSSPSLAATNINDVQSAIDRWIETSQKVGEARKMWIVERELLLQEEKLLLAELSDLKDRRADLDQIHLRLKRENTETAEAREALSGLAETLESRVAAYAGQIEALLPYFPEPLLGEIAGLLPRLRANSTASLGERTQAIFAALVEAEKFDRRLTLAYEAREMANGDEKQVIVLYWGMAFALSLDLEGGNPQMGKPEEAGWTWTNRPDAAASIAQAIAVYQEKAEPAFTRTPVAIGGPDAL